MGHWLFLTRFVESPAVEALTRMGLCSLSLQAMVADCLAKARSRFSLP